MKKLFFFINILFIVNLVSAQSTRTYYLTTNLLSPVSGLNKSVVAANALLPVVSNLEYGLTLSGGYFKDYHSVETRLTYGKSNDYNSIPQIQVGYNFFVFDYFKQNESGLYLGGFARFWSYKNKYTDTRLNNISSNFTIGYFLKKNKFIWDFRLNQPITIFSKSNIENTKGAFEANFSPMPELSPVLPFLSINFGYRFSKD